MWWQPYFFNQYCFAGTLCEKMKCTGEFYEDAAKFAEDYDDRMKRSKKGEVVVGNGKKKYLRNVKMAYKGTYAKAIFYRQVLEYRKTVSLSLAGIRCCFWL